MSRSRDSISSAVAHLRKSDAVLRPVIDEVGEFTLRPQRDRFGLLVRSIISQQISTKAARSIRQRLEGLVAPGRVTAEKIVVRSVEELRGVGLSPQKTRYLLDLSERALDGRLKLRTIGRLSDEDAIDELTQVKGVGRWTAQMFLMFGLLRLDVLPHDDLGIKTAFRDMYRLETLPDRETMDEIAARWRPYATVACWYCWRFLELRSSAK